METKDVQQVVTDCLKQFSGRRCDHDLFFEIEKALNEALPCQILTGHLTFCGDFEVILKVDERKIRCTGKIVMPLIEGDLDEYVKENK